MKRLYVVTMSDGSRWAIPAEIIAENRARYYASIDPDTTFEEEMEAMLEWFDSKDYEFKDWAVSNMDWDDVKDKAYQLSPPPAKKVDYQDGWIRGETEYITEDDC